MNLRPNGIALPVHFHESASRSEALDLLLDRAFNLVADEQHIIPNIAEHGFEVVDDMAAGAYAVANGRLGRLSQTIDHGLMGLVTVHHRQVVKGQRLMPASDTYQGFGIPKRLKFPIDAGQRAAQGESRVIGKLLPPMELGGAACPPPPINGRRALR